MHKKWEVRGLSSHCSNEYTKRGQYVPKFLNQQPSKVQRIG